MKKQAFYITTAMLLTSIVLSSGISTVFAKDGDSTTSTPKIVRVETSTSISKTPEVENENDNETPKVGISQKVENKSDNDSVKKDKCTDVSNRVQEVTVKFQNNKDENVNRFTKAISNLNIIITKLNARGVNTSELTSEITQLQGKIDKYKQDMLNLITSVNSTKDEACTTPTQTPTVSPSIKLSVRLTSTPKIEKTPINTPIPSTTNHVEGLENSIPKLKGRARELQMRQLLAQTKSDLEDIKSFFKTVLKPTIEDLRNQIPQGTETPKVTESPEPTTSTTKSL